MSLKSRYKRRQFAVLMARLGEPRRFVQVLRGPRQVGKTYLARQIMEARGGATRYCSADGPVPRDVGWIEQQWEMSRLEARAQGESLLILDEIHKVQGWSESVKALWDADGVEGFELKVLVLGSSPLLVQKGLGDSMAGRFESVHMPHWSLREMKECFDASLEQFVFFGGYPGAQALVGDEHRWARYVEESLIEATLSRDILTMTRIEKPALLARLFALGCEYSGQVLSYTKMLGQLQERGNTTTLAHYLSLLGSAGLLTGLQKYTGSRTRRRGSSPKLLVLDTSLMSALSGSTFEQTRSEPKLWGRHVESAVGAHLVNGLEGTRAKVHYWRDRNREVDFVIEKGGELLAIEVKSASRRVAAPGLKAFERAHGPCRKLLVGGQGMDLERFLSTDPISLL